MLTLPSWLVNNSVIPFMYQIQNLTTTLPIEDKQLFIFLDILVNRVVYILSY